MNKITRELVRNNRGTIKEPMAGDIRHGLDIGKIPTGLYAYTACPYCDKGRWVVYKLKNRMPAHYTCTKCKAKKELNGHWKGGRTIHRPSGYVILSIYPESPYYGMGTKSGAMLRRLAPEHRLIMAQQLGRCLARNEEVHHKNGIKTDNRIENLELTLHSKHIIDHHKGYTDGYDKGYKDGMGRQIQELKALIEEQTKQIRMLQWKVGRNASIKNTIE